MGGRKRGRTPTVERKERGRRKGRAPSVERKERRRRKGRTPAVERNGSESWRRRRGNRCQPAMRLKMSKR